MIKLYIGTENNNIEECVRISGCYSLVNLAMGPPE